MLSIDKKWLQLNKHNAEILLNLIAKKKINTLNNIVNILNKYISDPSFSEELNKNDKEGIKKIFWKFPLIVSSFFASERSFLKFDQVFNPKLRGQHGAGVTSVEKDITKKYFKLGSTDTEIFKKMANDIFA